MVYDKNLQSFVLIANKFADMNQFTFNEVMIYIYINGLQRSYVGIII
jgi:hypothetical protein